MKKLALLLALAALLGACTQNNDDNDPVASPFAGNFTGTYLVTSSASPSPQVAQVVVTDNPDGTVQIQLTVDAATATLTGTLNGSKLEIASQALFGNTAGGTGEMPATDQLHISFIGTTGGGGTIGQPYSAEFLGDR